MAVSLNTQNRESVEVRWEAPDHDGDVQVFAQGADGAWHNTPVMPNDGLAELNYPGDFVGSSLVEVRDMDGNVLDSGTISVGGGASAGDAEEEPAEEDEAPADEGESHEDGNGEG